MNSSLVRISTASEIVERLRRIGEDLAALCADLVESLKVRPELHDELAELGLQPLTLKRMEDVGSGRLPAALLFDTSAKVTRLLTFSQSERDLILRDGVEVLLPNGDTIRVPFAELTNEQAHQALGRGLAQQKIILTNRKAKVKPADNDIRVMRDRVIFHGYAITKSQLLAWLAEIH